MHGEQSYTYGAKQFFFTNGVVGGRNCKNRPLTDKVNMKYT